MTAGRVAGGERAGMVEQLDQAWKADVDAGRTSLGFVDVSVVGRMVWLVFG